MQKGFSLVEISVVLVILALLIGSALAGKNLIQSAELRATVSEAEMYRNAAITFEEKYHSMPGDYANATDIWGGPVADCMLTVSNSKETCNGDGDGRVDYDAEFPNVYLDTPYEGFRAWQHLANAELISGKFTGAATQMTGGFPYYTAGVNIPESAYEKGVGWSLHYLLDSWSWTQRSGHYLILARPMNGNGRWHNPALSPQDLYYIDKKFDDALPYSGRINDIGDVYTPDCTTSEDPVTAQYDLQNRDTVCLMLYSFRAF